MALTLDATVGGANANSYINRTAADALLEANPYASAWAALTNAQKDVNLVRATTIIDTEFDWLGHPTAVETQALEWPRTGVVLYGRKTVAIDAIPTEVQRATAELAFYYSRQTEQPADSAGLSNIELPGGLKLGFRESTVRGVDAIPDHIRQMLRKLVTSAQSSGLTVAVERC